MCTHISDLLCWILSSALERNLGTWLLSKLVGRMYRQSRYWCRSYRHPLWTKQGNRIQGIQTSSDKFRNVEGLACINPKGFWGFQLNMGVMKLTCCNLLMMEIYTIAGLCCLSRLTGSRVYETWTDRDSRVKTTRARNAKFLPNDPVLRNMKIVSVINLVSYLPSTFRSWSVCSSSGTLSQENYNFTSSTGMRCC